MKKTIIASLLLLILAGYSCTSAKNLLGKKTAHKKYEDKLEDAGMEKTPEGRQWLAASTLALENAQEVSLPYRQLGYFPDDKSRALGLEFSAKKGERLDFSISKKQG